MRGLLQVLALCSIALAAPSQRTNYVIHERRTTEPIGWLKSHRADADDIIPLRIGMKQQNLHMLDDLLMDVAHPDSLTYGQHWTPEKVIDFFAPGDSTFYSIRMWLSASGISEDKLRLSPNRGWIELNVSVAMAEQLLDTEYHIYEHLSGTKQIGTSQLRSTGTRELANRFAVTQAVFLTPYPNISVNMSRLSSQQCTSAAVFQKIQHVCANEPTLVNHMAPTARRQMAQRLTLLFH